MTQSKYPSLIRVKMEALFRERERERVTRRSHLFDSIITKENLLVAWREFLRGKRGRNDVADFSLSLSDNVFELHRELASKIYQHGQYESFRINDPKPRQIHKATVRDRLLHHAIYRVLYPYFEPKFIFDSFSCRLEKGTHKAMNRVRRLYRRVSRNNRRTVWVLKCDIRKFFASIDHRVLDDILQKHIHDEEVFWLLREVVGSYHEKGQPGKGLPLGNLTSQLLVNVYMNEFDHFVKRDLKEKQYIRYADDFVILHTNKQHLVDLITPISTFLQRRLHLTLHPRKVSIATFASGIDFLGWIHFPHHRVLRTSTRRRMIKRLGQHANNATISSYLGLLRHGNTFKLEDKVRALVEE